MRLLALLAAGLLAAGLIVGCGQGTAPSEGGAKGGGKPDEEAILGTWKPEKIDFAGGPGGPSQAGLQKRRFVFEKGGVHRVTGGDSGEEKGTFKLDPTAKVKAIDLVITPPAGQGGGEDETQTILGVYELDGDTLKLGFATPQKSPRPEALKPDGKGVAVITFTRVK